MGASFPPDILNFSKESLSRIFASVRTVLDSKEKHAHSNRKGSEEKTYPVNLGALCG